MFNQTILDRIRATNKRFTNKLLIHLCGKRFGHFAVLGHTGRRSGKLYRIPVIAEPIGNGFVIALTYGRKTDWLKNVLAAGGASLLWKNREYRLTRPEFIPQDTALGAFPGAFRQGLKMAGVRDYLRLEIQG